MKRILYILLIPLMTLLSTSLKGQNVVENEEAYLKEFDLYSFKDAGTTIKDSSVLYIHMVGIKYGYAISSVNFKHTKMHTSIKSPVNVGVYYTYMHSLLGRMPSAVGYQPTLASEMGKLQERIVSTGNGSITSVQAVYVPADDLTDPAPATTFAHLDATTVLSRNIASQGIYPAVDPLESTSRILSPDVLGEEIVIFEKQKERKINRQRNKQKPFCDGFVLFAVFFDHLGSKADLIGTALTRACLIAFGRGIAALPPQMGVGDDEFLPALLYLEYGCCERLGSAVVVW